MTVHQSEIAPDPGLHLRGAARPRQVFDFADYLEKIPVRRLAERLEDFPLPSEIGIETGGRYAARVGDVVDPGATVAEFEEQPLGRDQDRAARPERTRAESFGCLDTPLDL